MKKVFILMIIGLGILLGLKNAKAAPAGYEIRFEADSCDVPIGGDIVSNLPEAYVYDTYNERIVSTDMVYYYDNQGNKIENIDRFSAGRSYAYVSATSNMYPDLLLMKAIAVNIIDDEAPTIFMNSTINVSYENDFVLDDYLIYRDNAIHDVCQVDLIGDYENKKVGSYNMKVVVTDASENATEKDFLLNIYDNKKPVIECKDIIDINIGIDFDINDYIKVYDEYDGYIDYSITDYDITKLGKNNVKISAKDSSNNEISKNVVINIVDTMSPVITLGDLELNVMEGYDLKDNILSVTDNYDSLDMNNIKIEEKRIGTQSFLVTYFISDISGNKCYKECIVNYSYNNKPIIEAINLDDLTDIFDPFYYVKAYDVEDGDITNKIVLVDINYEEKYGIYEVYDSDNNLTRTKINYVSSEDLDKYENKTNLSFPKDDIDNQSPISDDNAVKSVNSFEKKNYNFLYYIILGVIILGVLIYLLIKHFKKKMV